MAQKTEIENGVNSYFISDDFIEKYQTELATFGKWADNLIKDRNVEELEQFRTICFTAFKNSEAIIALIKSNNSRH